MMLRRSLLKAALAAPLGLLFGKKSKAPPLDTQAAIENWLKYCGDKIAEELGWPKGSIILFIDAMNPPEEKWFEHTKVFTCFCPNCLNERSIKRICNIDMSKAKKSLTTKEIRNIVEVSKLFPADYSVGKPIRIMR